MIEIRIISKVAISRDLINPFVKILIPSFLRKIVAKGIIISLSRQKWRQRGTKRSRSAPSLVVKRPRRDSKNRRHSGTSCCINAHGDTF